MALGVGLKSDMRVPVSGHPLFRSFALSVPTLSRMTVWAMRSTRPRQFRVASQRLTQVSSHRTYDLGLRQRKSGGSRRGSGDESSREEGPSHPARGRPADPPTLDGIPYFHYAGMYDIVKESAYSLRGRSRDGWRKEISYPAFRKSHPVPQTSRIILVCIPTGRSQWSCVDLGVHGVRRPADPARSSHLGVHVRVAACHICRTVQGPCRFTMPRSPP
jgi:hypothetical protein